MAFQSHWPFLLWAYGKRRGMGIKAAWPDGWYLIHLNERDRHCRIGRIELKKPAE